MKREDNDRLADVVQRLANSTASVARAVTPDAAPGMDAAGGTVASLTEAVMGVTDGLVRIADAIHELADATRDANARDTGR